MVHMNHNLNQGLMQLQQKTKRGQRRHFPAKKDLNEFELLMKGTQQQKEEMA